jgi:hypothetical protein
MKWRASTFVLVVVLTAAAIAWPTRRAAEQPAILFSPNQPSCAIVIPRRPIPAELRAAAMLQATLAKSAGTDAARFRITREGETHGRAVILLGDTSAAPDLFGPPANPPFDAAVGVQVRRGRIAIRSERRESCEMAASWFLERYLGAHWFMPGPLGESIPHHDQLELPPGTEIARPGFISRELGGIETADGAAWRARNRLESRFEQGHSLAGIFRPEDLRRTPDLAPLRSGQKYFPPPTSGNWQPNLTSTAAVQHAAAAANGAFAREPNRISFSLGENDSIRFDESDATLAAIAPPRFFRGRPDYSDLVFGFMNAVADRVRPAHPNRWLTAYAYLWAENAPRFPVRPNVLPILTADRSQWFDPRFAAEDQQLISAWCRSGAGIVGVYDYFYGAPFLVPRPTLYAIRDSIPFEYRAGVRSFYAETFPNWGLDGPKAWLAAQLLWAPEQSADRLLETYYREFWGEAAAPMREFFDLCDDAWRNQPPPAYWLKYYKDEQQLTLFPPALLSQLRERLASAGGLARNAIVRQRVEFVSAAFSVTEAFAAFSRARDELGQLAAAHATPSKLVDAWLRYTEARREFTQRHAAVRRDHALALASLDTTTYYRNDSSSRAIAALLRTEEGRRALTENAVIPWSIPGATVAQVSRLVSDGRELLADPTWSGVNLGSIRRSIDFDWTLSLEPWRGTGEPCEGRTIELRAAATPKESATIRFAHCKLETMGQWARVTGGGLVSAKASVRAKVSPGNATYLIVSFLDEKQQHLATRQSDRLAPTNDSGSCELDVMIRVPANARYVGFGLCVTNQVNDDFAEFSNVTLKHVPAD